MTEPFLAEVRMFGFDFAPRGWAKCDGQILPINQNQSLFSLLGTIYGGDGRTTFALPDLRGRAAIHEGGGRTLGERNGEEAHQLTLGEIPGHTHQLEASADTADQAFPTGHVYAASTATDPGWVTAANLVAMGPGVIANTGSNQGHDTMQPFLTLNFCIAITGTFPPRN